MPSKLLAVEKFLTDMWAALPELEGVKVTRGWSGPLEDDQVFTTDLELSDDWASLGALAKDETGTVRFAVSVKRAGAVGQDGYDEVTDRVSEIAEALWGSVSGSRQAVTLSGLVLWVVPSRMRRLTAADDAQGSNRRCLAECEFTYKARI